MEKIGRDEAVVKEQIERVWMQFATQKWLTWESEADAAAAKAAFLKTRFRNLFSTKKMLLRLSVGLRYLEQNIVWEKILCQDSQCDQMLE